MDKTVAAHAACLPEPPIEEICASDEQHGDAVPPTAALIEYPLARRNRERHTAIHDLLAAGRSRAAIPHEVDLRKPRQVVSGPARDVSKQVSAHA